MRFFSTFTAIILLGIINLHASNDQDLKPSIIAIENLSVINEGDYAFYLTFDVKYSGADYVTVEIEEEYNTSLRNYRFEQPDFAHVKTGNITTLNYSWVYVTVKNEYGSDRRTLEFAPSYGNADIAGTPLSAITTAIQLYAIDGHIVFEGTPADFSDKTCQPGIYIKKEVLNDGSSKTSKIYIKSEDFSR